MAIAKRVVFFVLVNILIVTMLSITLAVVSAFTGINFYGSGYGSLAALCFIYGMGSSLISLAMSRMIAKWSMGVKVIDPNTRDPEARELLQTVHQLSRKAGLTVMPEVGYYESPEVNAFATGPTKNRSLVAVSSGLLQRMRTHEVEGVLGHEVAHIANGDMVTMTLLQGVVNAFVMFFARIIASIVGQQVRDEMRYVVEFMTVIVLQIAFGMLGMVVVASFSRWREYRADRGGATLAGREKMIAALQALRTNVEMTDPEPGPVATLKISNRPSGLMALMMTHPPLENRIRALERAAIA
ncbi:MAG TPA: protease HtpX [Bdellovibrionales bacterium]|nr:protease HtpX [Bdellovibrionales bacterium]